MIQPDELREGNWLITLNPKRAGGEKETWFRVSWRHLKTLRIEMNTTDFKPVPLTPDILFKCGWRPKGNPAILYHPKFGDEIDTIVLMKVEQGYATVILKYDYRIGVPLFYLHQLQNRFYSLVHEEMPVQMEALMA